MSRATNTHSPVTGPVRIRRRAIVAVTAVLALGATIGGAPVSAAVLVGGGQPEILIGTDGPDRIDGGGGNDVIDGGAGNDRIDSGAGTDTLTGGTGRDRFSYLGDPFEGRVDPFPLTRQVIGNGLEDGVVDFSVAEDRFFLAPQPEILERVFFNGSAAQLGAIERVPNVVVLQDSDNDSDLNTSFNAGTAANLIAAQLDTPGPGYFVYFNSILGKNRLVYSTDLSVATADLKIVNRFDNAIGQVAIEALPTFTARNFTISG